MNKEQFRDWVYENYHVPADNLAPDMLDGILDYAGKLDREEQFLFFQMVFPDIPEEILRQVY